MEKGSKGSVVRGKYAKFINENPRFVNEPIHNIDYTTDSKATVSDCMKWMISTMPDDTKNITKNKKSIPLQLPSLTYSYERSKAPKTTIQNLLDPSKSSLSATKELISFRHQYDCRKDPNEPIRGKLHGSFVWELR